MGEVDLGGFSPFNNAHAIYACTLTLILSPLVPGTPVPWTELHAAAKKFTRLTGYGAARPTFGMNMLVDQSRLLLAIDRPVSSVSEVLGYDFQRVDDDLEMLDRITIAANQVAIHTQAYIRWKPLFDQWRQLIETVAPFYVDRPVGGVRLEYWDRFDSNTQQPDFAKLLRDDSPYLAQKAIGSGDFWNSGVTINSINSFGMRRMLQTKVEFGLAHRNTAVNTLHIQTVVHDTFAEVSRMDDAGKADWQPYGVADAQHDLLKDVLAEVISDAAIARIALRAGPDV